MKADGQNDTAAETVKELKKKRSKPFFLWKLYFSEVFAEKGSFDIVIGNPPYVQIQGMQEEYKLALENENYTTFARTGDLYCLFYERGYKLSKGGGQTALITSNSWMRAAYGEKLRKFLKINTKPEILIDFSDNQMFESAIVNTNVLVFSKSPQNCDYSFYYTIAEGDLRGKDLSGYISHHRKEIELSELEESGWTLASNKVLDFKRKIESIGTPLKEWDICVNRGVTTGLVDAFIIDEDTKKELIRKDPKSSDIIKPLIRGRDVQKYRNNWENLYLICTFPSLKIDIDTYPAIKDYLKSFGKKIEQTGEEFLDNEGKKRKSRKKTSHKWFEVQDSTSYWKEFQKEKLFWIDLVDNGRFSYDSDEMFAENTAYIMTGESIKYLVAILNSKLINYYFSLICATSGMGTNRWIKIYVMELPIPKITDMAQQPFVKLVDIILRKKGGGENTKMDEDELDRLVYKLYGLNNDEIAIVEEYNN